MSKRLRYLLDADSFIRSKREHYAFDFCPAYWDALLRGFEAGRLLSIEPIRKELLRGKNALADWVRDKAPEEFFEPVDDTGVQTAYAKIIQWGEEHPQYTRAAKQAFARSADPWLIAFAATFGHVLVTYEVSQPTSKALLKLPDAARQFKVESIPPYVMLRQLKVRFQLAK
jgi:hypothetical protein